MFYLKSTSLFTFGFHGFDHFSFSYLSKDELYKDLIDAYNFFKKYNLVEPNEVFTFSYPYGGRENIPNYKIDKNFLPFKFMHFSTLPKSKITIPRLMVTKNDNPLTILLRDKLLKEIFNKQCAFKI